MLSRCAAFVIWASVAALAAFWSLRLLVQPMPLPAGTTMVATAGANQGDLSRLFGSDVPTAQAAPVVQTDARFQLVGVVAPRSASARDEALAVIAFDGRPAKAYRIGAAVDGDLVLQAVHARGAVLGPPGQPAQVDLELAALPAPATGFLPHAQNDVDAAAQPAVAPVPAQPALAPPAARPPPVLRPPVQPGSPAGRRSAQ